jgi:hypothetical protein
MKLDIGKFNVKSGQIVIGDPYHSHLVDAKLNILDVKKGRWNCRIIISTDDSIADLIILHKDLNFKLDESEFYWEDTDLKIEIDSGMAGIFDVESFLNEDIILEKHSADILSVNDNKWLNYCDYKSTTSPFASSIPNGVISQVCSNMDFYNVYVITDSSLKIVGIKVKFVTDYMELEDNF